MEVKQKAALIYNAIEDKKGSRISVLDISSRSISQDQTISLCIRLCDRQIFTILIGQLVNFAIFNLRISGKGST